MSSIQARIAALNLNQVNPVPQDPPPAYAQTVSTDPAAARRKKGPPPPLPSRPPRPGRIDTSNTNGAESNGFGSMNNAANGNSSRHSLRPPPTPGSVYSDASGGTSPTPDLPPRRPSAVSLSSNDAVSPMLPPRRQPSQNNLSRQPSRNLLPAPDRRASTASTMSIMSNASAKSASASRPRIVAPDYDASTLPPLPVRRPAEKAEKAVPKLPMRPAPASASASAIDASRAEQSKSVPPLPSRPGLPSRPNVVPSLPTAHDTTPPVPLSSRPDLASLQASKPKPAANTTPPAATTSCLICRDFSGPDAHAARFPRESIPSQDIRWLAAQLTAPFSGPTDKARAIFTWLHHNIAYDTKAFFGGNVRGSTPASTLASGLAVCEGYAGLFNALAASAGVESVVITGHGKGIGYSSPDRNNLPPPNPTGHAWNAFRQDDGTWKLTDPCWGAGHIACGTQDYKKAFAPQRFTQSNEDFGIDHFPDRPGYFFRQDGRALSWAEYMLLDIDKPRTMGGWSEEGWKDSSLQPRGSSIRISGAAVAGSTRFMFTKVCPHWDPHRNGAGANFLPFIQISGRGGGSDKKQSRPMQTDGYNYWLDVPTADLGAPGQQVSLIYMDKLDGKPARGLTAQGYERFMGENRAKSWSWSVLGVWELV